MSNIFQPTTKYIYMGRAEFPEEGGPEEAWEQWSIETHIPELLAVPGFVSATRMREIGGRRAFVTGYEIESPDAVKQPEYLAAIAPHEFTPHLQNVSRTLYQVTTLNPWADLT